MLGRRRGEVTLACNAAQVPVRQFVEDYFGFQYSMRGWAVLILVGFVLVFRMACIVALRKLNFQKR